MNATTVRFRAAFTRNNAENKFPHGTLNVQLSEKAVQWLSHDRADVHGNLAVFPAVKETSVTIEGQVISTSALMIVPCKDQRSVGTTSRCKRIPSGKAIERLKDGETMFQVRFHAGEGILSFATAAKLSDYFGSHELWAVGVEGEDGLRYIIAMLHPVECRREVDARQVGAKHENREQTPAALRQHDVAPVAADPDTFDPDAVVASEIVVLAAATSLKQNAA